MSCPEFLKASQSDLLFIKKVQRNTENPKRSVGDVQLCVLGVFFPL